MENASETSVDNSYCTCYEVRSITDQIMNSSVKIFRFTETIERSMSKNCLGTVSQRTIRICQQRTVLVSQEESRSDSIYADRYRISKPVRQPYI